MNILSTAGRQAVVLALAATLLVPPAPARADEPIVRDHRGPMARIQVVVKKIRVLNDRDWGSGEMLFQLGLYCAPRTAPCHGQPDDFVGGYRKEFSAVDGQIVTLDQILPPPGSGNPLDHTSVYMGYPLYRGQQYELVFSMWEQDGVYSGDEYMGDRVIPLTQGNAFGIGSHNLRSVRDGGSTLGDFEIELEIQRSPVPDLRATGIKIHDLPGSTKKLVCMGVSNAGLADAGPFSVALYVDGLVPPGGVANAGRLASGDSGELCTETTLPASGQHMLSAMADPQRSVLEFNEINNSYEQPYVAATAPSQTGPATTPGSAETNAEAGNATNESPASTQTTTASSSQAQPDLIVSGLRVNGQAPDGKDDCKDGKNAVTVLVKNGGTANVERFAVRLQVDDDEVDEASLSGLEAGQERVVRFDEVRLKKGERTLLAVADAKKAVAESKEDNNELRASARCKDDDS